MPTFNVHISYQDRDTGMFAKVTHTTTQPTPNDAKKAAMATIKDIAILGTVTCGKIKLVRGHGSI